MAARRHRSTRAAGARPSRRRSRARTRGLRRPGAPRRTPAARPTALPRAAGAPPQAARGRRRPRGLLAGGRGTEERREELRVGARAESQLCNRSPRDWVEPGSPPSTPRVGQDRLRIDPESTPKSAHVLKSTSQPPRPLPGRPNSPSHFGAGPAPMRCVLLSPFRSRRKPGAHALCASQPISFDIYGSDARASSQSSAGHRRGRLR